MIKIRFAYELFLSGRRLLLGPHVQFSWALGQWFLLNHYFLRASFSVFVDIRGLREHLVLQVHEINSYRGGALYMISSLLRRFLACLKCLESKQ